MGAYNLCKYRDQSNVTEGLYNDVKIRWPFMTEGAWMRIIFTNVL